MKYVSLFLVSSAISSFALSSDLEISSSAYSVDNPFSLASLLAVLVASTIFLSLSFSSLVESILLKISPPMLMLLHSAIGFETVSLF